MEIICYLSNGYPTIEASYNMAVEYADAGCRMMEVISSESIPGE